MCAELDIEIEFAFLRLAKDIVQIRNQDTGDGVRRRHGPNRYGIRKYVMHVVNITDTRETYAGNQFSVYDVLVHMKKLNKRNPD